MLPCKQQNSNNKLSHASIKLFAGDTAIRRRVLAPASGANAGQDYCSQYGKVSLISQSGVHQLHIFIFVLAIFHVLYSVITMALAQAKVGGKDSPVIIECFNFNSNGKHDLIGKVQKSLAELEKLHSVGQGECLFLPTSVGHNHDDNETFGNGISIQGNVEHACLFSTLPALTDGIKSILRNNSFYGIVPEVIGELKELEMLDLGHNNFSGPLPSDLGNNLSLSILLLDNNELFGSVSPEIHELKMISSSSR
ncbi:Protein BONZAI 2 [Camellia lanceoleosa]|uniref:Protein BONZAI 2 n=1 Tax=Camellia lanceoleosa TaxID=1840588 RepID=A0ACC0H7T5_9ERIC|nr:Protein BONZAI 2 [Camellia lanceoleosa]